MGGSGGSGWQSWIGPVVGAIGGYMESDRRADQARDQAEAASGPWSSTTGTTPWGPAAGPLQDALDQFYSAWQNHTPSFARGPGGGGPSRETTDLLNQMQSGSLFNEGFGGGIRDAISRYAGGGTEMSQDLYNRSVNYRPDYIDSFIQSNPGQSDPWMNAFLGSRMLGLTGGSPTTSIFNTENLQGLLGLVGDFVGNAVSSSGGGGGGGGSFNPGDLGEPTNDWMRSVLDGEFLDESNPHLQGVIDDIRQQGLQTYTDSVVPQIDANFNRAGRFGSNAYATAQAEANERANRGIGADVSRVLAGNYEAERGRMDSALGMLNNLDQTRIGSAAQVAAAGAGAGASRANALTSATAGLIGNLVPSILGNMTDWEIARMGDTRAGEGNLLAGILGYGDDRLAGSAQQLEGIMGLNSSDLAALGLGGNMAGLDSQTRLEAIGAGNANLGLNNDLLANVLQGRFAADNQRQQAANARYQHGRAEHDYFRDYDMNHASTGLDIFSRLATQFGQQTSSGQGPPILPNTQSPWMGALMGGYGGYDLTRGKGGGNNQAPQTGGRQQGDWSSGWGGK